LYHELQQNGQKASLTRAHAHAYARGIV